MVGEIYCYFEYGIDLEDIENYFSFWNKVKKWVIDKNVKGFIYKFLEKKWVYFFYGFLYIYGLGGYVFYFFLEQQQFNFILRFEEFQRSNWFDEKIWVVILELIIFNLDVNLFCIILVIFEVFQLGVVNISIFVYFFLFVVFNRKILVEIYLYVVIFIFLVVYIVDEGYIIMQERVVYVISVYNLFNFVLKCIFVVLIVFFFRKYFLVSSIIQFYLSNIEDFIFFYVIF